MSDGIATEQNELTALRRRVAALEMQLQQSQQEHAHTQEENTELAAMINSVGDTFLGLDRDWCFRYVNVYGAKLSGLSVEDLIGKNLWEYFPQLLGTVYETYYRQAMAEQKQVTFQAPSASSSRCFEVTVSPSERGLAVYGREIGKRKAAEEALKLSEERFAKAFRASPDGVSISRLADGRILEVNESHERITGFQRDESIGKTPAALNLFAEPDARQKVVDEFVAQGFLRNHEVVLRTKTGKLCQIGLSIEPITIDGEACLLSIFRDISARKQAEAALREREQAFTTLANSIPQLAWMTDATGWIFWYNQRWYEYTGTTLAEVEGWAWQKLHHPDHVDRVVARIKEAFDTGEPWEDTFPLRGQDGTYRWFLSRALPIHDDAGQIVRWFGTNTDITERQEHEAERERLLRALAGERAQLQELTTTLEWRVQERTSQVQSLAARLSLAEHRERKRVSQILHDHVQQMLYGIQWRTYMIEADIANENQNAIEAHLVEMKHLINEAVQAARTLTVELSPPVLENEGLPEAVAWLASQMKELHALVVEIETQGDCRIADKNLRELLFQIVRELLFNVVKHARAEHATVRLRREDEQIVVTVEDGGAGFDITTLSGDEYQNEGFGLFSIRERVDLFAGRVEVVSTPGAGTKISVALPLAAKSNPVAQF